MDTASIGAIGAILLFILGIYLLVVWIILPIRVGQLRDEAQKQTEALLIIREQLAVLVQQGVARAKMVPPPFAPCPTRQVGSATETDSGQGQVLTGRRASDSK